MFFHKSKSFVPALAAAVLLFGLAPAFGQSRQEGEKVNINAASAAELAKLPQIGLKIAQRIIDYRKESGGFKRVEDIMKVKGIGEKTFGRIKDLITVGAEASAK